MQSNNIVLKDISISLKAKDFLAVLGKPGSGKTSLMYSILGETIKTKGDHRVKGKVALVDTNPVIFADTLQQNITCGLQYREDRFRKAVTLSQMENDIPKFEQGLNTVLRSGGPGLSDALKARLSLARAIYKDADVYLIDDVLSIMETFTGNQIFKNCITKALRKKCVVLATSQSRFIQENRPVMLLASGEARMMDSNLSRNFDRNLDRNVDDDSFFQYEEGIKKREQDTQLVLQVDETRIKSIHTEIIGQDMTKDQGKNSEQPKSSHLNFNKSMATDSHKRLV